MAPALGQITFLENELLVGMEQSVIHQLAIMGVSGMNE